MADKDVKFFEDLHKKQFQLYIYIKHVGFTTWQKINKVCNELVSSCNEDEKAKYGKYPIYKIFVPLVKNGIIDNAFINDEKGFSISKNIGLFSDSELTINDNDIRRHFLISDEKINFNFEYQGKQIINRFPCFNEIISNWNSEYILNGSYYIKREGYYLSKAPMQLQYDCIYKHDNKPFTSTYYYDSNSNKGYEIPNNDEELLNLVRLFIRIRNNPQNAIIYNNESRTLSFSSYNEIPTILYRAFLMQDIKQLVNLEIFCDNRNNIPFSNISLGIYKNLMRIFELTYKD